jgi:RNA polymerase sigma-70 factor (ECF subfamily)
MGTPEPHPEHDELLAQLGWMRALAMRLVRDPDVADDVLQRACLLALQQSPDQVRTGDRLRAWLASVTRRMVGHAWRTEDRRSRRERVAAKPEALPATVDLAARREILRRLVQAVTALDEPYFSTLVRRYYEGLSTTDIAAQDGIAPEAVRQRLSRARRELRQNLEQTLQAGWLPSLSIASSPSHPFLRGLIMAEQSARPLILKSVAAIVVAAISITAWLTVRPETSADESGLSPATNPVVGADADPQTSRFDLPSVAQAPAESIGAGDLASSTSPTVAPVAADPTAEPATSTSTWDQLWKATDATMRGDVALADILSTSQTLLDIFESQLTDASNPIEPARYGATESYPLFEAPGFGKASLTVSKGKDEGQRAYTAYAFNVELDTRSGYYTGVEQDQDDETTTLTISYALDEKGAPRSCATLAQNMQGRGKEFHARMQGLGPMRVGGCLSVSGESSHWAPLTLQAIPEGSENPASGKPAGPGCFVSMTGDHVAKGDSLADPALGAMSQRLNALPVAPGH